MSVLIKGAKPPSGCRWCYFNEDCKCALIAGCDLDDTNGTQRRKDCPLIELPDHGDLVDAQMLDADLRKMMERAMKKAEAEGCEEESYFVGRASAFVDARRLLNDWKRAVIIPAERSEE